MFSILDWLSQILSNILPNNTDTYPKVLTQYHFIDTWTDDVFYIWLTVYRNFLISYRTILIRTPRCWNSTILLTLGRTMFSILDWPRCWNSTSLLTLGRTMFSILEWLSRKLSNNLQNNTDTYTKVLKQYHFINTWTDDVFYIRLTVYRNVLISYRTILIRTPRYWNSTILLTLGRTMFSILDWLSTETF